MTPPGTNETKIHVEGTQRKFLKLLWDGHRPTWLALLRQSVKFVDCRKQNFSLSDLHRI